MRQFLIKLKIKLIIQVVRAGSNWIPTVGLRPHISWSSSELSEWEPDVCWEVGGGPSCPQSPGTRHTEHIIAEDKIAEDTLAEDKIA